MKHLFEYENFISEKVTNGPAFSIHDFNVGDKVEVEGKPVEIVKYLTWVKNHDASCLSFEGKLEDGTVVTVKYDDGADGYAIISK